MRSAFIKVSFRGFEAVVLAFANAGEPIGKTIKRVKTQKVSKEKKGSKAQVKVTKILNINVFATTLWPPTSHCHNHTKLRVGETGQHQSQRD